MASCCQARFERAYRIRTSRPSSSSGVATQSEIRRTGKRAVGAENRSHVRGDRTSEAGRQSVFLSPGRQPIRSATTTATRAAAARQSAQVVLATHGRLRRSHSRISLSNCSSEPAVVVGEDSPAPPRRTRRSTSIRESPPATSPGMWLGSPSLPRFKIIAFSARGPDWLPMQPAVCAIVHSVAEAPSAFVSATTLCHCLRRYHGAACYTGNARAALVLK
jgi:hypothetical protein